MVRAHRFAYEQAHGPIGQGLHCCHHCDNRLCVNPAHLFLGTNQDNINDRVRKGRSHRNPTYKGEGHPKARLTVDDVVEIRRRWDAGEGQLKEIGVAFGVSKGNNILDSPPRYGDHGRGRQ